MPAPGTSARICAMARVRPGEARVPTSRPRMAAPRVFSTRYTLHASAWGAWGNTDLCRRKQRAVWPTLMRRPAPTLHSSNTLSWHPPALFRLCIFFFWFLGVSHPEHPTEPGTHLRLSSACVALDRPCCTAAAGPPGPGKAGAQQSQRAPDSASCRAASAGVPACPTQQQHTAAGTAAGTAAESALTSLPALWAAKILCASQP